MAEKEQAVEPSIVRDLSSPTTTHPRGKPGAAGPQVSDRVGILLLHADASATTVIRQFYDRVTGNILGVLEPGAVVDVEAIKGNLQRGLDNSGVVDPGPEFESVFVRSSDLAFAAQSNLNMAQSVFVTDIVDNTTYNVDMDIYVYERGCSDPDTCPGGVPLSSGYTWFMALQVVLGDNASDDDYGMHVGMAKGGIAQKSNWYADWSGYTTSSGAALPNDPTGWDKVLDDGRWYTLRVWRLGCVYTTCGWGAWVIDKQTGEEFFAGSYTLDADTITNAASFSEVVESNPCATDILGVHMYNRWYRTVGGGFGFPHAQIGYQPVCGMGPYANTNIRGPFWSYSIDDRMVPRTNFDHYWIW